MSPKLVGGNKEELDIIILAPWNFVSQENDLALDINNGQEEVITLRFDEPIASAALRGASTGASSILMALIIFAIIIGATTDGPLANLWVMLNAF